MATIKEIANAAGVSVATVSRYINKSGYVGEKSQKKIKEAIEKFNYRPNINAQILNNKSSKLIGLIVPDIANPFFTRLINGAEETATKYGYMLTIANGNENSEKIKQQISYFSQYKVAGILCADDEIDMESIEVPVVQLDREIKQQNFYVGTDHEYGGKLVAECIKETSYHKILYISGPKNQVSSIKRLQSFLNEFQENDITCAIKFLDSYTYQTALNYIQLNYKKIIQYDTIIASNDLFALLLTLKLQQKNVRVPEDVQIIGYDGIDAVQFSYPKLMTIQQPDMLIGSKGCELLINIIENKEIESPKIFLKPRISKGNTLRKEENAW